MGHSPLGTHWCRHMLYMRQAEHGERKEQPKGKKMTHTQGSMGVHAPRHHPGATTGKPGPLDHKAGPHSCPTNLTLATKHPGATPCAPTPWHTQRMLIRASQSRTAYENLTPASFTSCLPCHATTCPTSLPQYNAGLGPACPQAAHALSSAGAGAQQVSRIRHSQLLPRPSPHSIKHLNSGLMASCIPRARPQTQGNTQGPACLLARSER